MYKLPFFMLGAGLSYWFYIKKDKGIEIGKTGRYIPSESLSKLDRQVQTRDYAMGEPGDGAPDAGAADF